MLLVKISLLIFSNLNFYLIVLNQSCFTFCYLFSLVSWSCFDPWKTVLEYFFIQYIIDLISYAILPVPARFFYSLSGVNINNNLLPPFDDLGFEIATSRSMQIILFRILRQIHEGAHSSRIIHHHPPLFKNFDSHRELNIEIARLEKPFQSTLLILFIVIFSFFFERQFYYYY